MARRCARFAPVRDSTHRRRADPSDSRPGRGRARSCRLRPGRQPAALYVEVSVGVATVGTEVLGAGQRAAYGDWTARRRLGPRVAVFQIDARRLEAGLPSGKTRATLDDPAAVGALI